MRVLVACEFSGVVREAFRRRGHDAWSCDLIPAEDGSEFHIKGTALHAIHGTPVKYDSNDQVGMFATTDSHPWDLLIGHPPCTYLTNSGVRWLYKGGRLEGGEDHERRAQVVEAARFFKALWASPIKRIAIENPIMHGMGRELIEADPAQIIQPWQFGHGETKATCLWLKNLPKLVPTDIVEGRHARVHLMPPGPDRWKERSRTMQGIADAMADQWGHLA
jgi:hypothetical protein